MKHLKATELFLVRKEDDFIHCFWWRPCPFGPTLLTAVLSRDCVTLHDVTAYSTQLYRCRPVLPMTLLLIYSFCSQNSQRLKA